MEGYLLFGDASTWIHRPDKLHPLACTGPPAELDEIFAQDLFPCGFKIIEGCIVDLNNCSFFHCGNKDRISNGIKDLPAGIRGDIKYWWIGQLIYSHYG